MKIIGKQHKVGEYEKRAYDNTILVCVKPYAGEVEAEGCNVEIVKVKASVCAYENLHLGDEVEVYYDRYGNVAALNIIKAKEDTK